MLIEPENARAYQQGLFDYMIDALDYGTATTGGAVAETVIVTVATGKFACDDGKHIVFSIRRCQGLQTAVLPSLEDIGFHFQCFDEFDFQLGKFHS
jgi:hypothetical protein